MAHPPMAEVVDSDSKIVFHRVESHSLQMICSIVIGSIFLGLALLMFLVNVFAIPGGDPIRLNLTTTMPAIFGMFGLIYAFQLSRAPRSVCIRKDGCEIVRAQSTTYPWSELGSIQSEESSAWGTKVIHLKDRNDKKVETITGIQDLPQLVEELKKRVQASGGLSASPGKPTATHIKRGRKRAIGFILGSMLTSFGCGFMLINAMFESKKADAMTHESIEGRGLVTRKLVAPNGLTKRLYVQVEGENGESKEHNFEVSDACYENSKEGSEIPIVYVPYDPRMAELVDGQIKKQSSPWVAYGASAFFLLLTLLLLAVSGLSWFGYDIKFDEKNKGLVPIGE